MTNIINNEERLVLSNEFVLKMKPRARKILCELMSWPMGFNSLKDVAESHPTSISRDLNLLMKHGLVRKKTVGMRPKQVEYSLTDKGKEVIPSLLDIVRKKSYI